MLGIKSLTKKDPLLCPYCKIVIKDGETLMKKVEYSCGSCSKIFFIEKTPSFYYYATIY
jgi:DNA-directed RNA polymerase subunit RPC12/RpoP